MRPLAGTVGSRTASAAGSPGARAAAGLKAGDALAFGHTHKAWHRTVDDIQFVNTGSVGRPKDGDPRAGYVVLDIGGASIQLEIVRVHYDVEATAAAIMQTDLPHDFADYLRTGGRPVDITTGPDSKSIL